MMMMRVKNAMMAIESCNKYSPWRRGTWRATKAWRGEWHAWRKTRRTETRRRGTWHAWRTTKWHRRPRKCGRAHCKVAKTMRLIVLDVCIEP